MEQQSIWVYFFEREIWLTSALWPFLWSILMMLQLVFTLYLLPGHVISPKQCHQKYVSKINIWHVSCLNYEGSKNSENIRKIGCWSQCWSGEGILLFNQGGTYSITHFSTSRSKITPTKNVIMWKSPRVWQLFNVHSFSTFIPKKKCSVDQWCLELFFTYTSAWNPCSIQST